MLEWHLLLWCVPSGVTSPLLYDMRFDPEDLIGQCLWSADTKSLALKSNLGASFKWLNLQNEANQ